jgi:hypothetical protein
LSKNIEKLDFKNLKCFFNFSSRDEKLKKLFKNPKCSVTDERTHNEYMSYGRTDARRMDGGWMDGWMDG